jgi:hypothetical protein
MREKKQGFVNRSHFNVASKNDFKRANQVGALEGLVSSHTLFEVCKHGLETWNIQNEGFPHIHFFLNIPIQ